MGRQYGKTPYQVALRWIVQQQCAFAVHSRSSAHLREDLDLFVSSLTTPPPGGIEQDLGLIEIVGRIRNIRITQQQRQQMVNGRGVGTFQLKQLEADMAEMERARGLAFGDQTLLCMLVLDFFAIKLNKQLIKSTCQNSFWNPRK